MSASNVIPYDTNVSNFVSVKLSSKQNYFLWKAQMLCLLNSVNICGILDDTFVGPRDTDPEIVRQYDNLVRGWIFGSVSEDVLLEIFNLDSSKAAWEKLQSNYDTNMSLQEESSEKPDAKTEKEGIDEEDTNSTVITIPTEIKTKKTDNLIKLKMLKSLILKGADQEVETMLIENPSLVIEEINSDGSTGLHVAVGIGDYLVVRSYLSQTNEQQVLRQRHSDGSTALHVAAIVGNTQAAELLVQKNRGLLQIKDNNGKEPLYKAYENMHLGTMKYLLDTINKYSLSIDPHNKIAPVEVIVNAISASQYGLASEFLQKFPKSASSSDEVLMAIAKNFPSGLDDWEEFIYPSPANILEMLRKAALSFVFYIYSPIREIKGVINENDIGFYVVTLIILLTLLGMLILIVPMLIIMVFTLILLSTWIFSLIVCFSLCLLYYLFWKGAQILAFPPIKKIENKIKEQDEAKKILEQVCDEIDKLNYTGIQHPCYTRPIIEAACQNAYKVVEEILSRYPEAIYSKDKSGYDIIQLAIINRSEKIYNLIYDIDERKNIYRTYKDSSKNNILHLAGKLAPSDVLNQRTGAALQVQRELQWREEVKKLVIPTYVTQENIFKETPYMVFTREHKNLVKQGEQWMKTTAESCSVAAALITTIVFAAAITVPGGSDQGKGTPLFKKKTAFIIFAISDAISLFASTTTLLVFLSILTTRFAEKDFLVSLPRRLLSGLFFLFLSTIAMMVAFSSTVFLVFCDEKRWMLALIGVLAFIPIASFVMLQFPLMVDLAWSTYIPIFGKQSISILKILLPVDAMYLHVKYFKYSSYNQRFQNYFKIKK